MSIEFDRGSPGNLDSRTLHRKVISRWTRRIHGTNTINIVTITAIITIAMKLLASERYSTLCSMRKRVDCYMQF